MGHAHLALTSSVSACPLMVGDPHPRRQAEETLRTVHRVLSVRLSVCMWDCTDLLPLGFLRLQSPRSGCNLWCYLEGTIIQGAEYTWVPCFTTPQPLFELYQVPFWKKVKSGLWMVLTQLYSLTKLMCIFTYERSVAGCPTAQMLRL